MTIRATLLVQGAAQTDITAAATKTPPPPGRNLLSGQTPDSRVDTKYVQEHFTWAFMLVCLHHLATTILDLLATASTATAFNDNDNSSSNG